MRFFYFHLFLSGVEIILAYTVCKPLTVNVAMVRLIATPNVLIGITISFIGGCFYIKENYRLNVQKS